MNATDPSQMFILQRLQSIMQAAGIPVSGMVDYGPDVTPRFRVDIDITGSTNPTELEAIVDDILANFDTSPEAQAAWRLQQVHVNAKTVIVGNDANSIAIRAALKVSYASMVETRNEINAIVAFINSRYPSANLAPLANRSWADVVAATQAIIAAGQAG